MGGARHQTPAFITGLLLLGAVAILATLPSGCRDENDPNYWLGKMSDVVWRDQALTNLDRLFSEKMREASNNRQDPQVQEFVTNVGGELIKVYQSISSAGGSEDVMSMNKIVSLLSQMDSTDALPVYQSALGDVGGTKITRANTAAQAIGRFCISNEPHAEFIPPLAKRDETWRGRCSKATVAVESLIKAIDSVSAQRLDRGENAENTPEEDALAQSLVSALGNILLGNPQLPQRSAVLEKLIEVVETPDTQQDLRINFQAINMLGQIGDNAAIPLFAKALFMQGRRRPVALQEIVRPAMMQVEDLNAMAEEMIKVGRMQNKAVSEMQRQAPETEFDIRIIQEQTAITLGMLGISSPSVIDYLNSEFNHIEADTIDNTPGRGVTASQMNPTSSAAFRRSWAAQALAKLHHDPALPVLVERMQTKKNGEGVDYVWPTLDEVEIPGYLDALGDFLEPTKTNDVILPFALYADQARLDRAGRRLGLQAGPELATKLQERGERMEECDEETRQRGCLRDNFLKIYVPALQSGEGCNTVECWVGHLSHTGAFMRERAAFQLAMLAYNNEEVSNAARPALIKQLVEEDSQDVAPSIIFSIDRLSPNGCSDDCRSALQEQIDQLSIRGSQKASRRFIIGLLGRLSYRAGHQN